jgi:hypothetical protein
MSCRPGQAISRRHSGRNVAVPALGDYSTTFFLHYSDEQDLPGALAAGSEMVSFNVNANVASDVTTWTVTAAPEPNTWVLAIVGAAACAAWRRLGRLRGT